MFLITYKTFLGQEVEEQFNTKYIYYRNISKYGFRWFKGG